MGNAGQHALLGQTPQHGFPFDFQCREVQRGRNDGRRYAQPGVLGRQQLRGLEVPQADRTLASDADAAFPVGGGLEGDDIRMGQDHRAARQPRQCGAQRPVGIHCGFAQVFEASGCFDREQYAARQVGGPCQSDGIAFGDQTPGDGDLARPLRFATVAFGYPGRGQTDRGQQCQRNAGRAPEPPGAPELPQILAVQIARLGAVQGGGNRQDVRPEAR